MEVPRSVVVIVVVTAVVSVPLPFSRQETHVCFPGYQRDVGPTRIPDKPPYLAHLGNLDYEVKVDDINELLDGCEVISVRLIEDRELKRPKGFGYAEFGSVDGLKKALAMDGVSFQGRSIKIRIADPRTW